MPDVLKTQAYLLTQEHLPKIPPYLQELNAWTLSGWTSHSVLLARQRSLP